VKKRTKVKIILGAIGAFIITVLILIKEILRGRVTSDNLDELKKGILDEKKENDKIIKDSMSNIKIQNKLIKERENEVRNMTMKEQAKLAKKMGLI